MSSKVDNFKKGSYTKQLILSLSEDLLNRFKSIPLVKTYNLYQHLMDYWAESMQDDFYLVSNVGWLESVKPRDN